PSMIVAIKGHTDAVGDADYNQRLSLQRATAVRDFLITAGINPAQLESQGLGESAPMANNETTEGRRLNRRVELALIGTLKLQSKPASPPPPQKIYVSTFSAKPDLLTVPVGTKVSWINYDEISHDISFDDKQGDRIWTKPWLGAEHSRTFDQAGEYNYRCSVHKDVNGKIVVTPRANQIVKTESPAFAGHTTASYKAEQTTEPYNGGSHHAAPSMQHTPGNHAMPMHTSQNSNSAAVAAPEVLIARHAFSPQSLVVAPGTTVSWDNQDASNHIIVFGTQQSEVLKRGSSYSRSFAEPGEYPYHCGVHGYMTGTIVVQGG
ncbi:MAG: cupredoxin domain-containing protein, partial [Oceanococcus sp.]